MPKVEIDYSNTIIYKITCKDPNVKELYVGHTTNFVQRKHNHKTSCNNPNSPYNKCKLYQVIRNNGGWNNWVMEIIDFFNCDNLYEARKKEEEYFISLNATLNSNDPISKNNFNITKKNQKIIVKNEENILKNELPSINGKKYKNKYYCEKCDYTCCKKFNMNRHLTASKHIMETNGTDLETKTSKNEQLQKNTCKCGKQYKNKSGLWKHHKKCSIIINDNNTINELNDCDDVNDDDESNQYKNTPPENPQMEMLINLFQEQLKENKELKELIIEQQKKILEMGPGTTNNITNNNTMNNKFNLNVFLNETCKDALNLSDFLESLILTLTDFENFGPLGYCGGITNILVNGLNKLDISKRPIHCSDLKREVIHIKNNNTWHKDDDKQQMIKAIKAIEHKNIKQMSLWGKANPEYKDPNHKKSDLYTKLIDQSLCDSDKEKALKNYNKIIRTVAKEVLVDK